ncbi:uncharacterized protein LOC120117832 [Hibiscus syriacus]|uniref:uncharacterized protein LOC120117832 n=1 Tax=Hibiscus syriacus TaxID=106335 RepID=UPI0019224EBE|nr:uncharacterized protein LOC120117832 [Hibiscus syriacus]
MANPSKLYTCFVLLTFLSSSIFTSSVLCDEATQALIDKICRRMEEYAFCNDAFQQNLKGSTANITALTQIAVEQTLSSASDTHEFIVGLLKNATDPAEKNALITCENAYNNVITFFQQATTAFNQEDYKSMLQAEQPAPRAQASCTTIFNTPPNPPNPVGERNTHTRILIAMSVVAGTELTSGMS